MAKQHKVEREDFALIAGWPSHPATGGDRVLDSSVGRVEIRVNGMPITEYRTDKGDTGEALTIPLYGLVDWLTSNWWPLFFEPRKSDNAEDDPHYRSRHWLGYAREGLALPDLWLLPAGDNIDLIARESYLRFARLTFPRSADASVSVDTAMDQMSAFVENVLTKMDSVGVAGTEAHQAWEAIRSTLPDEKRYCRLVGSLGLSPYARHEHLDDLLDRLSAVLDDRVLTDLCQASSPEAFERTSATATEIFEAIPKAHPMNLAPLAKATLPPDRASQAYRWGLEAAETARNQLGISKLDPEGGASFLRQLDLDPQLVSSAKGDIDVGQITAGVGRHEDEARVAIVEGPVPQRRFAAVRSAFIGWVAQPETSRLVTAAKTREQQASRSFAAEILAPIGYIKRRTHGAVSSFGIERIAGELEVSPAVVRYQVQNNKIGVAEYY